MWGAMATKTALPKFAHKGRAHFRYPLIPKSEAAARATQPGGLISNHKVAAARSGPGGQWTWKSLSELLGQERRCQFVDALIRANK